MPLKLPQIRLQHNSEAIKDKLGLEFSQLNQISKSSNDILGSFGMESLASVNHK